jgi:chloramphenicol 3-O-phosphotransferase
MKKIVFLTGAPASGKTTIARMLAQNSPKSIHIQVDQLREMMVSGIHLPGGGGWSDEATRQFQWGRTTASFMANLYASNGVDAFIDDVCVPHFFSDQYAELFKNPAVHRVLFLPSANALVQRLKMRAGPFDSFFISMVPWLYEYLVPMPKDGWIVLDSSEWSTEQTLQEVLKRIN